MLCKNLAINQMGQKRIIVVPDIGPKRLSDQCLGEKHLRNCGAPELFDSPADLKNVYHAWQNVTLKKKQH